jgi:adenylate cyclase
MASRLTLPPRPPSSRGVFAWLFGDPERFSLQHRLLLACCMVGALLAVGSLVLNALLGMPTAIQVATACYAVVILGFYRLLRRRPGRFEPLALWPLLLTVLFVGLQWLLNAGFSGGMLYVLLGASVAALTVRGWRRVLLLAVVVVMVGAGFLIEWRHPEWILSPYDSRAQRIADLAVTFTLTLGAIVGIVLTLIRAYDEVLRELREERERSDHLLLQMLPAPICERLKRQEEIIADGLEQVTVLFADLVGFTRLSASMDPEDLVAMLNNVFSAFDQLVARHGLEKIKTIGDAYMAVAGAPEPRADHARAAADLALDMLHALRSIPSVPAGLELRIGLSSGPAVAGVIGQTRFAYDLWGDTVNAASRMESHGLPGRIQVTEETRRLLGEAYRFEPRGPVTIKGLGEMQTWFLEGQRAGANP